MINTIRIKKKYIFFFVISFFFTFGLVSFLNSSSLKNIDSLKDNCSKHTLKVNYKYQNSGLKSKKSKIHKILVNALNDELLKIMKSKKNYYFSEEKIVFSGMNCKENSEEIVAKKEIMENAIRSTLMNLNQYLTSNSVLMSVDDYHVIHYLGSRKTFIEFEIDIPKNNDSSPVKNIIRFFIIIFLLNLIFYLLNTIKVKID